MAALVFFIKKERQLSLTSTELLSTQLYDSKKQILSLSYLQTCLLAL